MKSIILLTSLLVLTACHGHRTKRITTEVENPFDNSTNEKRLGDLEFRLASLEASVALNISQIELNSVNIDQLEAKLPTEVLALQTQLGSLSNSISAIQNLATAQGTQSESLAQDIASLQSQLNQTTTLVNQSISQGTTAYYSLLASLNTLQSKIDNVEASGQATSAEFELQLSELDQQISDAQALLNQSLSEGTSAYNSILSNINTINNSSSSLQTTVNSLYSQLAQIQIGSGTAQIIDPCPLVPLSGYKEMLLKLNNGKLVAYFEDGGKRFLTVLEPGNYQTTDRRACNFTITGINTILN